jgi:hypothetical protein
MRKPAAAFLIVVALGGMVLAPRSGSQAQAARASAQAAQPSSQGAPAQTGPQASSQPSPAMSQEDWQATMSRTPAPKKGCFTSSYPSTEWREVPCTTTPTYPQVPARGPRVDVLGSSFGDWAANIAGTNTISSAIGSFDSVTGVTSESGPIANAGPSVANAYTLQLNTDFFMTTACAGSPNTDRMTGCRGWEQFVF